MNERKIEEAMKEPPSGTQLAERTKKFSLSMIFLHETLHQSSAGRVIGKQMLRSATSVGAQYREARRARSKAEFTSKIDSAIQELDETTYWLELLIEARLGPAKDLSQLYRDAQEILAMLVASSKTAKANTAS